MMYDKYLIFAATVQINHKFNTESEKVGYDWLNSFLWQNPLLSIRKAEGLSLARSEGMSQEHVANYFRLLMSTMKEGELLINQGTSGTWARLGFS